MSLVVNWTDEAKYSFNENIKYLEDEWDSLTINNFFDRVDEVPGIDQRKSQPLSCVPEIRSNPYNVF